MKPFELRARPHQVQTTYKRELMHYGHQFNVRKFNRTRAMKERAFKNKTSKVLKCGRLAL